MAGSTGELGDRRAVGTGASGRDGADLRGQGSQDRAGGDDGRDADAASGVGCRGGDGERGGGAGGVDAVGESPGQFISVWSCFGEEG